MTIGSVKCIMCGGWFTHRRPDKVKVCSKVCWKARLSERASNRSPERREQLRQGMLKRWQDPKAAEEMRRKARSRSPEALRKNKLAIQTYHKNHPEVMATLKVRSNQRRATERLLVAFAEQLLSDPDLQHLIPPELKEHLQWNYTPPTAAHS